MKKLVLFLSFVLFSTLTFAQIENYNGSQHFRAGANFFGNKESIKVAYDYGLSDLFSVGAGAYVLNNAYAFVRGDFHVDAILPMPKNLGVYGAVELGVVGINFLHFDPQIGVAYALTDNIDAFFEIGNTGTLGVSFLF